MVYNQKLNAQYEIMTAENQIESGEYVPSLDALIEEAPTHEMKEKWVEVQDLIERTKDSDWAFKGFAFNCVYVVQKSCGHYEVFQHPAKSESELLDWIENVELKSNQKCSRCISNF